MIRDQAPERALGGARSMRTFNRTRSSLERIAARDAYGSSIIFLERVTALTSRRHLAATGVYAASAGSASCTPQQRRARELRRSIRSVLVETEDFIEHMLLPVRRSETETAT